MASLVAHDDPILTDPHYAWQVAITTHPIIRDDQGIIRYKRSPLVNWLLDRDRNILMALALARAKGEIPLSEYMQFHRDIGYSLAGFDELFGDQMERGFTDE